MSLNPLQGSRSERSLLTAVIGCLMLATACGSGGPDRTSVLADLANEAIIPAYEQFDAAASDLQAAAERLCDAPGGAALTDARRALAEARGAWSHSEAMWVGPVMDRRSWAVVRWPIAVDEIEELIADTSLVLDHDRLANRIGADQRGLGAVEHVLHTGAGGSAATSDRDVLEALDGSRRCDYLRALTGVITEEASLLATGWTERWDGGQPYRDQFISPDGDGLDTVVNDSLFLLEAITDLELGAAIGTMDREPDPAAIDEGPAAAGVEDLTARLDGVRAVLVGNEAGEEGLAPLLGDDIAGRLRDQLSAARAAVGAVDPPLRTAVAESPESVAAARDAIKAVQITVATEVVSHLGVTVGFSDADGDSAG